MSLKKLLNKFKTKEGFTFVEVIMSILIIGIVAMYLGTAIPTSLVVVQRTQDVSKAADLAQRYFENVKYQLSDTGKYDEVLEGTTPPIEVSEEITDDGYFDVATNVSYEGNETIAGVTVYTLKRLDITFSKPDNDSSLVSYSTELARPRD